MEFPVITEEERRRLLAPPSGKVEMVLDTDTYNEVDDQFALAYALMSPEKLDLKAVYAAPFSSEFFDRQLKSKKERVLSLIHIWWILIIQAITRPPILRTFITAIKNILIPYSWT